MDPVKEHVHGALRGKVFMREDFDALPEAILVQFKGNLAQERYVREFISLQGNKCGPYKKS